jgi:hypothetical protein
MQTSCFICLIRSFHICGGKALVTWWWCQHCTVAKKRWSAHHATDSPNNILSITPENAVTALLRFFWSCLLQHFWCLFSCCYRGCSNNVVGSFSSSSSLMMMMVMVMKREREREREKEEEGHTRGCSIAIQANMMLSMLSALQVSCRVKIGGGRGGGILTSAVHSWAQHCFGGRLGQFILTK